MGTAANTADVTQVGALPTGEEASVHADAGYTGEQRYVKGNAELHVAEKRSKVKAIADAAVKEATATLERLKAQLRARVEHPFQVLKFQFGFTKVRYRGPAKNTAQLQSKRPATTPTAGPHPVLSLSRRALSSPQWAAGGRCPGCA